MAETLIFDVTKGISLKLGSLAIKELWWGVKEELENLEDTVSTIQAVLLDAEEEQKQNNQFRNWLGKLKDAVYDAEDLLDDLSTKASQLGMDESRNFVQGRAPAYPCLRVDPSLRLGVMTGGSKMIKKVRLFLFFSSLRQLVYGLKMAYKVKKIRERLDKIADDRSKFHFIERQVKKHVENREGKQTYSFVLEEEVIGREEDIEKIIKLLLESNVKEIVSVIPIVGIGGLGKTTLARLSFNDRRVKTQFDLKMWVCVSDDFDVQIIAQKILESATGKKLEKSEMNTLQSDLRKKIDGKKYLLVLDNVSNEDIIKWDSLRNLLRGGASGSKIVVTTRNELVATITATVSSYHLKGLSEEQSWSLLAKMASIDHEQVSNDPQLEEIGIEIAKKCAGVPLAVKTLGRVLFFKRIEEWQDVMNNELATITQQENGILPILKLCYDHLPSHLKQCFTYCSLFPKDHVIGKQTLINLWMAQGFIQSSTGDQHLEDVGHEYFMDLVWRSFFQEVQKDGDVESCKMHDLIHDLARLVGGTEYTMVNLDRGIVDKKTRHVSFGYKLASSWKIPAELLDANRIRTIFWPGGKLKKSNCSKIVSTYKCLRALDLHNLELKKVPCAIGKLKRLRYLDLSENDEIRKLPNSISRLHNLQTLKLSDCDELVELPSDIRKMVSLRHLIIGGCSSLTRMPTELGQLTSLRTLSLFVVGKRYSLARRGGSGKRYSLARWDSGKLGELNGLNNLRGELEIIKLQNATSEEASAANLKAKQYLQSLRLNWSHTKSKPYPRDKRVLDGLEPNPKLKQLSVNGFLGVKFSDWLSSLTYIVEIKLEDCKRCQDLPPLHKLPCLTILHLKWLSDLEYITSEESSTSTKKPFFPSLKGLYIGFCNNLKGWWNDTTTTTSMAELPSFPCLSKLEINVCPNLISMPLYPSLEEYLVLWDTSSKPLQETMMMDTAAPSTSSSSSSSSYPLSKLKSLFIRWIDDLKSLPEEGLRNLTSLQSLEINGCRRLMRLPAEGFRGLTSLRYLEIWGCASLNSLSREFQNLSALEKLKIANCEELDLSTDDTQWQDLRSLSSLSIEDLPQLLYLPEGLQYLTSLEELRIRNCEQLDLSNAGILFENSQNLRTLILKGIPKLVSLPDEIQHVTTLQKFEIGECHNFTSLPEWIGNLTSLQVLELHGCPELTSLPEGMHQLTALQYLTIIDCGELPNQLALDF